MEAGGSSLPHANAPMNVGAVVPSSGTGLSVGRADTALDTESPSKDAPRTPLSSGEGARFAVSNAQSLNPEPSENQATRPSLSLRGAANAEADAEAMPEDEELELPELTDAQLAFVESERYRESAKTVEREFALGGDDLVFLAEMDRAVFGGLITLPQYAEALRGEFANLNADEKDRLIGAVFAARFVPFAEDMKPSAEETARMLHITLPVTPYYRVYTKPLTFSGAAHEVALMGGIPLMRQAQERIRDIFMSRLKGVRSDTQAEEQLTRPPDVGGVGAKPEAAKAALAAMDDIAKRAELLSEEEYAAWLNRSLHPSTPEAAPTPAEETEEEKEIREIAARMPRAEAEKATVLSSSVSAILGRLSWKPNDSYLDRRLVDMVSTRLRDVRSRNECFMKLMRDTKVGGLGLDRKTAEVLSSEIEQGYEEFRDRIAAEEKEKLDQQMLNQERKIEERKHREAEARQRWYEEKVSSKKRTEEANKGALGRLKTAARGFGTPTEPRIPMAPVEEKDRARERAAFGELVPAPHPRIVGATSSVAPTSLSRGLSRPNAPIPAPATPHVDASRPPLPVRHAPAVKVSIKTAELQKATEGRRPKLDDIAPAADAVLARPAGPLEQIGGMTLAQFRRLGSPPSAAAHRIEELVGLLAQESFERRVAGVQAWQKSPLQALYLKLVAEAFRNGKPVKALVEVKRAAGEEMLTVEELDAIIALNGVLRIDH